jgi:predicted lactoylglutathione lyase
MPKMIFINLPITNLARSTAFYEALGGTKNAKFSDETSACMVFSETIQAMLLTHDKYRQFTSTPIADAHATSAALIALTVDSRDEVNATIDRAAASGGRADPNPTQDQGFMFGRSVQDPDGHVWEIFWMDPATAGGA